MMINERYFDTFRLGMSAQIKELSIDEVASYVQNHIHSFLMDESICFCFIERLANDGETAKHPKAGKILLYLFDKALQLRPFRPGLLEAIHRMTGNPQVKQRLDIINKLNESKETYDMITGLDQQYELEDARKFINELIHVHPTHMAAAQYALNIDRQFGTEPGPWFKAFLCPPELRRDWEIAVFNHYAALCMYDKAVKIWPGLKQGMFRETTLNLAAEMFIAAGDIPQGLELYAKSLQQDPRQVPVQLRVRELQSPFKADDGLLDKCKVSILLYSWNKAELLGQTLESLSRSHIGKARIDVLLNGCTDNSLEIVEKAREFFPDNEFVIHNLHVNIGAPAARNWLMRLPESLESDYLAFLDDDVTVSEDWLASFLTVAEADEKVGVVGCKILHPGEPAQLQYLYRHVAIAGHGLLRMSIHSPNKQYDTHVYDAVRETRSVMGCLHLLRTSAQENIKAGFDIRFSPSQVDDIDHDIAICLEGYKVMYCGLVACIHHQSSGTNVKTKTTRTADQIGGIMGNDIKLFYKHVGHLDKLKALDSLSIDLGFDVPDF